MENTEEKILEETPEPEAKLQAYKRAWNYGSKKTDEEIEDENEPKMTLREHMTRPMECTELILLLVLLLLVGIFFYTFFNPLINPMKDPERHIHL